jgi:hypothetical protein
MFGSPSARPANTSTRPEFRGTCSIGTSLIAPRVRGSDHGAVDQFAPEDLDAFLDRLLGGAEPVTAGGHLGGRSRQNQAHAGAGDGRRDVLPEKRCSG